MDKMENSDTPILSEAAHNALMEFYRDRDAHEIQFGDIKSAIHHDPGKLPLTMDAFAENWNESQFWYSQETAALLAKQLLANSSCSTTIAVISAPSVFVQLRNLLVRSSDTQICLARPLILNQAADQKLRDDSPKIYLLEFDERFSVFPEFVHYDFHRPLKLPAAMKGTIDRIICDPPFLSQDCQTKAALTVRWLSKSWGANQHLSELSGDQRARDPASRLIVCTGERMQTLVNKLYRPQGIRNTTFMPVHVKGLSNEFYCYANFECDCWKWER